MTTSTPSHRATAGRSRRLVYPTALAVLGVTGVASAFWATGGTGTGTARTATLNPPTNVTATVDNLSVGVRWTAAATGDGAAAPTSYRVTRDGAPVTCGEGSTTTSCIEHDVPVGGPYTYAVTSVLGSWSAAAAAEPVTVAAPVTKPALTLAAFTTETSATPVFTGTTDAASDVTIDVFDASGTRVAGASATPSASTWTSSPTSPALSAGATYTARASQTNSAGTTVTEPITFTVAVPVTSAGFVVTAPSSATAGVPITVTVQAKLSNGANDTSYTGSKSVAWSGAGQNSGFAAPTMPGTLVFDGSGKATAQVTLVQATSTTLTVAEAGTARQAGASNAIAVGTNAPTLSWTSSTTPCADGRSIPIGNNARWTTKVSRSATDRFGNPTTAAYAVALSVLPLTGNAPTGPDPATLSILADQVETSGATTVSSGNGNSAFRLTASVTVGGQPSSITCTLTRN